MIDMPMMQRQVRHKSHAWIYILAVFVLLAGYCAWALRKPLPALKPVDISASLQSPTPASRLTWPAAGQSAAGLLGTNILETHGDQKPVPIASTAKLITSLVVLEKKPLAANQQGPSYTLTDQDVAFYRTQAAKDGSLLPVKAGQVITEYQMIQALMLPSANNIADTLALWAFGSQKAYAEAANNYLKKHGLNDTKVGDDASGLDPSTTSTAADLVNIGKLAMEQPVLAEIAAQPTAAGLPNNQVVKNVNSLLGTANIVGIKTGNTEQAGGVFISASKVTVNNKPQTIITAVAGTSDLFTALKTSLDLIKSAQSNFSPVTVTPAGSIIAEYQVPWDNKQIAAVTTGSLITNIWNGTPVKAKAELRELKLGQDSAGRVTIPASAITPAKSVPVKLQSQPKEPTIWWRLTHP